MTKGINMSENRKILRYGMIGGGEGAFIGDVHRKAASFDGKCQLAAGCFSRDYENTLRTGPRYGITEDRLYRSFEEMAQSEAKREDKIDFVSIVTPNSIHYKAAKIFLENGFNVVCDKPLTVRTGEAEELVEIAESRKLLFCVTYVYSGYPMLRQARELVRSGKLGRIIMIMGEYPSDWLITAAEKESHKELWRFNPNQAGISNCIADIGSHIENTVSFITGLKIHSLCAKLDIIGEGHVLDTNGSVLISYDNGASGVYWASQVAIGRDNALKVRIYGTKGSIEWEQENPNILKLAYIGQPIQILNRGREYLDEAARSRIPAGHPEGYYEAFSNIYKAFAEALIKKNSGKDLSHEDLDFPNVKAGLQGVKFINACVKSSKAGAVWVRCD